MRVPSSKTFVLLGFGISLVSVIFNTIVLSAINSRLRAVDSEYASLVGAFSKQIAQLYETEQKFDLYRIMHYMAFSSPEEKREEARGDAREMLKGFLTRYYAVANDVSPMDLIRVELDQSEEDLLKGEKLLELELQIRQSSDPAERARLTSEAERIAKEATPAKSELTKKLREVGNVSEAESNSKNELELLLKLLPAVKSFREQIAASIGKKENRMRELERQRSSLTSKADYATYAAVSLQIFGVMFILAKDWAKDLGARQ